MMSAVTASALSSESRAADLDATGPLRIRDTGLRRPRCLDDGPGSDDESLASQLDDEAIEVPRSGTGVVLPDRVVLGAVAGALEANG